MGTYENKLNALLDQGNFDAPNFGPVRDAFAVLSETLQSLSKHDGVQGTTGDAANQAFKNLRDKFANLEGSVKQMEDVVAEANVNLETARGGDLPSAKVPGWVDTAVDAADATSKIFIPAMGVSVAANVAKSIFSSFLGGQREEAAKEQYEALSSALTERGSEITSISNTLVADGDGGGGNKPGGSTPGGSTPGGSTPGGYTRPSYTPKPPTYGGNPGVTPPSHTGIVVTDPPTVKNPPSYPPKTPPTSPPTVPPTNPPTYPPTNPPPSNEWPGYPPVPNPGPVDSNPNDYPDWSVDSNDPGIIPGGAGTPGFAGGAGFAGGGSSQALGAGLMGGGAAAGAAALRYGAGAGGFGGPGSLGGIGGVGTAGGFGSGGGTGAGVGSGGLLGAGQGGAGANGAGVAGGGASSGAGGTGASAAGSRGGMVGMGGQSGGQQSKDKRPGLAGHIAPKLEDDDEFLLRPKSAAAGGRDSVAVEGAPDLDE